MSLKDGKIIYSYNIDDQISEFLEIKKKKIKLKSLMLIDNNLVIFLKNSYFLIFDIKGRLKEVKKINSFFNTNPIIVNKSILYLDNKNRLRVLN